MDRGKQAVLTGASLAILITTTQRLKERLTLALGTSDWLDPFYIEMTRLIRARNLDGVSAELDPRVRDHMFLLLDIALAPEREPVSGPVN